jgi:hypothetical protein
MLDISKLEQADRLELIRGNTLIDEFLGVESTINYIQDISSLFDTLSKIQTLLDDNGVVAYNYDVTSNKRQPEWGYNMRLYSSGDGHGKYIQFNIKNAHSIEVVIWRLVVGFIDEYNKQGKQLPKSNFKYEN